MRVHVAGDVLGGEVPHLREGQLGQELGDIGTDEVAADQLSVGGVGDDLHEADRMAEALRLAVGGVRELGHLDVVALVPRLGLGEPEGRDLRLAERGARHHTVVAQGLGLGAGHGLGGHDALRLGHVGELQLAGDVADGVDAVDVGAHVVVDVDRAAVGELDAGVLQAEALDAGTEADGHEDLVHGDRLGLPAVLLLDLHVHRVTVVGDLGGLVPGEELDAELLVVLGDLLGDLLVLVRQQAVHELDDRDLDAVGVHHVRELHADRARAHHDDRVGQLAGEDLLLVADHVLAQLDAREGLDHGAGGDDAVVERVLRAVDLDRLGVGERPVAVDLGDLVLLHEEVDALDDAVRDLAAAVVGGAEVEGDVAGDTEQLAVTLNRVGQLRITQQCL